MIVSDLVDTKEFFVGEIKSNYFVVYEKLENNNAVFVDNRLQTRKLGTQEVVQIFQGTENSSLCRVDSYPIGIDYPSLEVALAKVKETHQELFI